MMAYGITHCEKHLCEIPMNAFECPECKKEREEEKRKRKHEEQLNEFRKLIRQEISNYFNEEPKDTTSLPEALCCNCGQYFEYQKSDLELLKAPTKNIYFKKCPMCNTFTIVEEY